MRKLTPDRVKDVFAQDVARDIPPVVYFHEQAPATLAQEVAEYIFTGGYAEGDQRQQRVGQGIHEQYVRLLTNISRELAKKHGPELPAAWVSGFYGSGKSSFAKLLGLSLDGLLLPDGTPLAQAWMQRDQSPRAKELHAAWAELTGKVKPISVVFDIGSKSNNDEHVHSVVQRLVQQRLGYSGDPLVADYELKLEADGEYDAFLAAAKKTLGKEWSELKGSLQAQDHFSHVLHTLKPDRYPSPTDWVDSHVGANLTGGSVSDAVRAIEHMLNARKKDHTLFVVVDEVSQYVHHSDDRMGKLQSFVSELGTKLRGRVWLLATGQQKLEDSASNSNLSKMKDRFPPALRVHLATTNIRDVVHRRLLHKKAEAEPALRELFQQHRAGLALNGYGCTEITEEDFVEVYPMLPGHVDLLMQLTTNLRSQSLRVQGDDYAIRGLLQLLGELFREKNLAEEPLGTLVTLDAIYDIQHTALHSDVQASMARVLTQTAASTDAWARKVAQTIALLQLNRETQAVTEELIAQCLYPAVGAPPVTSQVKAALELLKSHNLVGYSEKDGYKIQSSAGQEWQRERDARPMSGEDRSELVREKLRELLQDLERPRLGGRAFPWAAYFTDGSSRDVRILDTRDEATVTVDFRFLPAKERRATEWVRKSDEEALRNRILWITSEEGVSEALRELFRSREMVKRYQPKKASLSADKNRLLIEELERCEGLEAQARQAVAAAFVDGELFFRSERQEARTLGSSFSAILVQAGERRLPLLYPHRCDIAVTEKELEQLLHASLSGVSTKFMEGQLGLLTQDGGRYVATCQGQVPTVILEFITRENGASGSKLLSEFAQPPYGYPQDVVRATVAGLLRAGKLRIRTEDGQTITSVQDPGGRDLFTQVTRLRRADLFPNTDVSVSPRDRVAMRNLFKDQLAVDVEPESDALADAVFNHFPTQRERLRKVEELFARLPGRPSPEEPLVRLGRALENCRRSRKVEDTVKALKHELSALKDGLELLGRLQSELTDEAVHRVRAAAEIRDIHLRQLVYEGGTAAVAAEAQQLDAQLSTARPWRDIRSVEGICERIRSEYRARRTALLTAQETEIEAAKARLRVRPGFEKLSPDQVHLVFKPIVDAQSSADPEAVSPALADLRDGFHGRLQGAEERASELFDQQLATLETRTIVKVETALRGKEISTREELKTVLKELEERVGTQLDRGHTVRLS